MNTIDKYTCNPIVAIWLEDLLDATNKGRIEDLSVYEVEAEIKEIKSAIKNESIWSLAEDEDWHENNLMFLEHYLDVLNKILNDLREEKKS